MEHSGVEAVHRRPNNFMKMHQQNQLNSLFDYHKVLSRIRHKKIDDILVQCPFKIGWRSIKMAVDCKMSLNIE